MAQKISEEFEVVKRWLEKFPEDTKEKYGGYFEELITYSGKNPDELLDLGRDDPESIDKLLMDFYYGEIDPSMDSLLEKRMTFAFLRNFFLH